MFKSAVTALIGFTILFSGVAPAQTGHQQATDNTVREHLRNLEEIPTDGTWPFESGYVRYDTLKRGKNGFMIGRWALTLDDACDGGAPFSSVPSEEEWKDGPYGAYCPDGMLALGGVFSGNSGAGSEPEDYIELICGTGAGCDGFRRTQRARNNHESRAIRATFQWRRQNGYPVTRSYKLEPGEIITVSYCNCGAVTVTGAKYVD